MIDTVLHMPQVLSVQACEAVQAEMQADGWEESKIGTGGGQLGVNEAIRSSSHKWLAREHWLTAVLWSALHRANSQAFDFELTDHEAVQLTRYQVGEHYSWHTDMFYPAPGEEETPITERHCRKLSICLQLTAPTDYVGGDLLTADAYGKFSEGG